LCGSRGRCSGGVRLIGWWVRVLGRALGLVSCAVALGSGGCRRFGRRGCGRPFGAPESGGHYAVAVLAAAYRRSFHQPPNPWHKWRSMSASHWKASTTSRAAKPCSRQRSVRAAWSVLAVEMGWTTQVQRKANGLSVGWLLRSTVSMLGAVGVRPCQLGGLRIGQDLLAHLGVAPLSLIPILLKVSKVTTD